MPQRPHKDRKIVQLFIAAAFFLILFSGNNFAQQRIAHVQPDALGPGMTITMEVLAPAKDTGAFGADGVYWAWSRVLLQNPADSFRVIFGPVVISWNGRVLQVPVMAKPDAVIGTIRFQVIIGNKKSAFAAFEIMQPHGKLSISGGAILGDNNFVPYSFSGTGNTIVADEIEFLGSDIVNPALFTFSTASDSLGSGNPHYHPVTLLSRGPIYMRFAEISVSADSLNGGPGGGGGGHGWMGIGGAGYTGGGSDSNYSPANVGSGASSTPGFGGASSTGIIGGASVDSLQHHGGGGGTGCPYGSSGVFSEGNDSSHAGGFGAGSAGGETPGLPFGGGGGAFATDGESGNGLFGSNFGRSNGGRFLLPMQGGSGGGAGNHVSDKDSTAGSGGGGGGALTIISFDTISCNNSFFTADGANGIPGGSFVDGGGGGGSGGGLLIAARNGISINDGFISASGGIGGNGGAGIDSQSRGGAGGFGRIRMDGEANFSGQTNFFSSKPISGPTLSIPSIKVNGPFSFVGGIAGDSATLTDTIRVYYRNHHSPWKFLDTIRFKSNGKYHWQALLPLGHDSELFVTAMAQVRNPTANFANFEPSRLLSHLSSGIINIRATPHLIPEQDTIDFGCNKFDTCISANMYLSNQGEDTLHITQVQISGTKFTVAQQVHDLGYYSTDSIAIRYCPKTVGHDTAVISFISNDTLRSAVLIGCGIDKDRRITIRQGALNFGRVHIGNCDTLKFIVHSVGQDSAIIDPNGFFHPPFSIISPKTPFYLASKDSAAITISFCPSDFGIFHSSFILTEKRDSITLIGTGTKRVLLPQPSIIGNSLCVGSCDSVRIKFFSTGNDSVHISNIFGASFAEHLPFTIPPQTDTEFTIRYCEQAAGDTSLTITYVSDADSSNQTKLQYHGVHPQFISDSALHFGSHCIPYEDSVPFSIVKTGSDPITISLRLKNGSAFSLSGDTTGHKDTERITVHFSIATIGVFTDSILAIIHRGECGDSSFAIPISGSGTNSDLVFSKNLISFGVLDTNSCKEDSIIITNPCTSIAALHIPSIAPPFVIVAPLVSTLSLNGGESKAIVYQYCPKNIGSDSLLQTFIQPSGAIFSLALTGAGLPIIDSPVVRFKLLHATEIVGKEFSYPILVDTLSSTTKIFAVQGSLHYDPTVVEPIGMTSTWKIISNNESSPGTYDISLTDTIPLVRGMTLASVQMLALYGPRDTTSVFLENIKVVNYAQTSSIPGFITVANCGNLPGNIIVGGDYSLGNPAPNPSTGNLVLPIQLGNDGTLRIRMYNESGQAAFEKILDLKRGEHTLSLDVSSLPSGIYYLSADSWGWREGKTVVIQK